MPQEGTPDEGDPPDPSLPQVVLAAPQRVVGAQGAIRAVHGPAVVRRENENGVVQHLGLLERVEDLADGMVQCGNHT